MEQITDGIVQSGIGFSSEALMKNITLATNRSFGGDFYRQYRYQSLFGRINYNYAGRYILNLTGRRDGSSRFGSGKQFANFGALGAAWIFSGEEFIQNRLPFLSFGKLRISYGTSGNDQIGDYQYLDSYSSSGGPYLGGIGLQPDRLSNPEYAWETNQKFEAGMELGFFNDRFQAAVSIYRNRSSNQLVGFVLPATTGFPSILANFPATVQNTGMEIELNTRNVENRYFQWNTSFNISIPRNKLVAFPNIENYPSYANTLVVGEPLSISKLYRYTGLDPAGRYSFKDTDGDGFLNFQDQQSIRFRGQQLFGGLNNSFRYKNFQLDILFQFVKQKALNHLLAFRTPGALGNNLVSVMDRWKNGNLSSGIQQFTQADAGLTAYNRFATSDESVTNASFIRLKNLSFSYTIPAVLLSRLHMEDANIFIQGQNLLTFTSYKGLDPETGFGTWLPPLNVLTAGIRITF